MMCGRLIFLEHCIRSEKEFPDLTDDPTLAGYQKEQKLGELVLFLPCPVLDYSDNVTTTSNLNDPSKNNAKKHARKASQENKKLIKPPSNPNDGFTSPKKFAKKIKLTDSIAEPSQPITLENKFSNLAGEETKINDQNEQRFQLPPTPKMPPTMFRHKKENHKAIIYLVLPPVSIFSLPRALVLSTLRATRSSNGRRAARPMGRPPLLPVVSHFFHACFHDQGELARRLVGRVPHNDPGRLGDPVPQSSTLQSSLLKFKKGKLRIQCYSPSVTTGDFDLFGD
ncbi:hypothetical protein TNIN_472701 [Trichonephila inaurata madagascariensis]|uniref:Uncharacterized protein n=1 Tax=Trichonephila inaurata madagascariensis TaxID=2747483 RepID=A0A8X6MC12_9ARAC|nr:hypothetical protein TNIN_472701 [Trichonephila inaurata madagascariensis]